MLYHPKSALSALVNAIDGSGEGEHGWTLGSDTLQASLGAGVYSAWRAGRDCNLWPRAGGWDAQPLALLCQFKVLDLVDSTWRYWRTKDAALDKLTKLQADLIKWLDK